jgi:hypothetical protein
VQVFPGRVRSQIDSELALQSPEIEVEDLVALRSADPRSAQPQVLESLDDHVEANGRRRLGAKALTSSPSVVMTKSRLPKRTCASRTQLMP